MADIRVIPYGADPPVAPRRRRKIPRRWIVVGVVVVAGLVGYEATVIPRDRLVWEQGSPPGGRLNADSLIRTPTGFSILAGPGPTGGAVWSTVDGSTWLSRPLPRLAFRIVFHPRGLFVVDRREVLRVGPDPDDGAERIDLPDSIRLGNGSMRSGLVAVGEGLVAQTVRGDVFWSPDGRRFEKVVEAQVWGSDADVPPDPSDVLDVAPDRVRSSCRPRARRAPDVPAFVATDAMLVAMVPEDDPSVVWPVCEPVLWTSFDGISWEPMSEQSPFPDGAYVYDLAWREGRFVAVGGIGYSTVMLWSSFDGRSWEPFERFAGDEEIDLTDVEGGPLGWVVVGVPRDGSDRVGWFSEDGECWEPIPEGVPGRGLSVGEDHILTVDGDPPTIWVGTPANPLVSWHRCL